MSILLLEEKQFPSTVGQNPLKVIHHKPLINGMKYISQSYSIGPKDFAFEYALEKPIQQADTDKVSDKLFLENFNQERFMKLIEPHKIIFLFGSKLCSAILNKKLNKVNGKIITIGSRIFIPMYSCFYAHYNNKSFEDIMLKVYKKFRGDDISRELTQFEIVGTFKRLKEVIEYRKINKICSFDFETTGFNYFDKEIKATVLSITYQPGYSYVIPFEHIEAECYFDNNPNAMELIANEVRILMEDPEVTKVGHNVKFDYHWLVRYNIGIRGRLVDTMVMSHLIDENRRHGLKDLGDYYFPFWKGYDDEVDYLGALQPLSQYAAVDTDITLMLFYIFENILLQFGHEKLYRLLRNLSMPNLIALQEMEYRGAKLDRGLIIKSIEQAKVLLEKKVRQLNGFPEVKDFVRSENKRLIQKDIESFEAKIQGHLDKGKDETYSHIKNYRKKILQLKTGQVVKYNEVNFASPKQVSSLIYDGFKFPVPTIRREKKRTTDRKYLKSFNHPFMNPLFAFKTIAKMISTYYQRLLDNMDVNDFYHDGYKLHGTVTGRLSAGLHNIPSRMNFEDEDAEWCLKQVKKFFIPFSDNYYSVQADYSQAELRIIANKIKDPVMQKTYLSGEDLHAITGARIRGVTVEEFYKLPKDEFKKYRGYAKAANFGWFYKSSIDGYIEFAKNTYGAIVDEAQAQVHKDAIFTTYKNVGKWHILQEHEAKKYGYVETLLGRRRRLPDIRNTTNQRLINEAIRASVNNPIQGSGGEYCNFAISLLHHRLPKGVYMWLTVHDSIFFYIPKDMMWVVEIINDTCEDLPLDIYFKIKSKEVPVPMGMDYEVSDISWRDMEEIGSAQDVLNKFVNKAQ